MIKKIVHIKKLIDQDQILEDLAYWLQKSPEERIAAVEFLRRQYYEDTPRLQRIVRIVQLGVPPVRIDLITSISGVKTEEAFAAPEEGTYGDTPVKFISRELFIKNKQASGRKRDLSDLESLGET